MFLAERAAPTGAFDFEALTPEGAGRVLRYAIVGAAGDGAPIWQPVPDEYAIGFPRDLRNGNGGVAIGYDYDSQGVADRGACGGFLWSTGEALRHAADPALAAQLAASGPLDVSGLQGNWVWLARPRNVPPLLSVFTDYDDHFDDSAARGHMGDLAIWRVCGPVLPGGWMFPGWIDSEVFAGFDGLGGFASGGGPSGPGGGACPADQKKPGFHCCPKGTSPDASGQCKQWCPSGAKNALGRVVLRPRLRSRSAPAGGAKCLGGAAPVAGKGLLGCAAYSPVLAAPICAGGLRQAADARARPALPTREGAGAMRAGPADRSRRPVPSALQRRSGVADRPMLPGRRCAQRDGSMLPAGFFARREDRRVPETDAQSRRPTRRPRRLRMRRRRRPLRPPPCRRRL